ncbi:MAG: UbiA prenyltransferase family protein [Thermoplasmatales archaeon]|nr:UbiA prenyltransferase family protein [Thermoplasmatales archaeon]
MKSNTQTNKLKSVLCDLSRIEEWWLLSLGLIFFAFIPHIFRINSRITIENLTDLFTSSPLYLALIVVFATQIFLFASNDYFDRHIDALDEKKRLRNPICTGRVTTKEVWALLIATAIISLVVSLFFSFFAFLFTAFALFVFYFYTAEPLRFKNKVGVDVLSHGIFINTFPYFFCLVALWDFSSGAVFLLAVLMMRSAIAQLLQEIRDYEVDKKVERNTVVALGQKRTVWVVFGIYLAIFFSTLILLVTYQLFNVGISLFYLVILFLCATYIPAFYKLLTAADNRELIDGLWVGQGRTNRWMGIRYAGSFSLYFCIVLFLLI